MLQLYNILIKWINAWQKKKYLPTLTIHNLITCVSRHLNAWWQFKFYCTLPKNLYGSQKTCNNIEIREAGGPIWRHIWMGPCRRVPAGQALAHGLQKKWHEAADIVLSQPARFRCRQLNSRWRPVPWQPGVSTFQQRYWRVVKLYDHCGEVLIQLCVALYIIQHDLWGLLFE